jgi:cyanate permease
MTANNLTPNLPLDQPAETDYRWLILALVVLTATLVAAAPLMALSVLFPEISADLDLSLLQVGFIWGASSFTGIFLSLVGGTLGDRFGTKPTLIIACLLAGCLGPLQGLATDFWSLFAAVFVFGMIVPVIPLNLHKACAVWFSNKELGLANGFVAAGMALGFLGGSLMSATTLSPMLGGWRRVIFFYSGLAVVIGLLWLTTRSPAGISSRNRSVSLREGLPHVAHLRTLWILGLTGLGVMGCIQGLLGYLPLYLRGLGWSVVGADSALATFHGVSLCAAIPLALLSDRLRTRRAFLMLGATMAAIGVGLLSVADGAFVWLAIILAGLTRDGFMAIYITTVIEIRGVGAAYAGTAMGLALVLGRIGSVVAPPLGNSLAAVGRPFPFLFWAAMALLGLVSLLFLDKTALEQPG